MNDPSGPVAAWRITGVVDTTKFIPTQGTIQVKRVNYVIFNGHRSYVDVPIEQYDAQLVGQMVDEAASKDAEIISMTGPQIMPQSAGGP